MDCDDDIVCVDPYVTHVAKPGEDVGYHALTHWGRDNMDAIAQTTFSSAFSWMKRFEFRLKFCWIYS